MLSTVRASMGKQDRSPEEGPRRTWDHANVVWKHAARHCSLNIVDPDGEHSYMRRSHREVDGNGTRKHSDNKRSETSKSISVHAKRGNSKGYLDRCKRN